MPQTQAIVNNKALNPTNNSTGGINWVSGLNGAKSWKMYPNTTDVLMDDINEGIYYIKISDNVGMTSALRAFSYEEIPLEKVPMQNVNMPQQNLPPNIVTREDFDAFKTEILDAIKTNNYHKSKRNYNNGGDQNERA